jgi:hypothetical protein
VRHNAAYAPVATAVVIAVVGFIAMLAHQPWLFPSLGPTIFLQAVTPNEPSARVWNTGMGHLLGLLTGFGAVFLFDAEHTAPALMSGAPSIQRVAATALALAVTVALQELLRARHAPAAATCMLITLGAMPPTMQTVAALFIGVALAMALGEIPRRLHPERTRVYRS